MPESVKETQWEAEKARLEREAVRLKGEVKTERVKSESLAKEAEAVKGRMETLAKEAEAKAGALHWWLMAAVIAGVFALLGGIGMGSSVRREAALKAKDVREGGRA